MTGVWKRGSSKPKELSPEPPETLPEEGFHCPKHGAYTGSPVRIFFDGAGSVFKPECPKCADEARDGKAHAESARLEEEKLARFRAAVGKIYWNESFETFDAYTPELEKHLATARGFAANPSGKLVMLGGNGTGKNHLAVSILRETGGVIYTAYEIGARIRQGYGGGNREWEVLGELCGTPLLVIDEIGRTKKDSKFDQDWLSHVVNKRHENMMPLVLISNLHLMEDCPEKEGCPKCLENFFDNDVISRITEDAVVMKFTGEDYRLKKRNRWFE